MIHVRVLDFDPGLAVSIDYTKWWLGPYLLTFCLTDCSTLQRSGLCKAAKAVSRYLLFSQYRPDDDLDDIRKVNIAVP